MKVTGSNSRYGFCCNFSIIVILCIPMFFCTCNFSTNSSDDNNDTNTNYSSSEDFFYRIGIEHQSGLYLDGINGTIEISGVSDIDSVTIQGERIVKSKSLADAEEHLRHLSVEISEIADKVSVLTEQPLETEGPNYTVNYHIQVPVNWEISVNTINGNVSVSSMENSVLIDLINGNVDVDACNANVDVDLTNGNVRLWDITGNIVGELTNGRIYGKIFLPLSGTCKLTIINGNIDLKIPLTTSAVFSARVVKGTIALSELVLQNQEVTSRSVAGNLGEGDGSIALKTIIGNIEVDGF